MRNRWLVLIGAIFQIVTVTASWAGSAEQAADYRKRAAEYEEQGKFAEAIVELRNAVKLEPKSIETHRALAEAYLKNKDAQGAFREYQEVVSLDPKDGEARLRVAGFYLLGRRFADAAEHAKQAVELLPGRFESHVLLARARAGLKEWEPAVSEMKRAIELAPDNDILRVELARFYVEQKNSAEGEQVLRQGLKAIPPSRAIRVALASMLAADKRFDEADNLMAEVLNLGANEPAVMRTVAAYRLKRGDQEGAESLLKKALQAAGDNRNERLQALGDLANFYSLLGKMPEAKKTLEEVKALAPQDNLTLARLANLHLLSDELDQAEPLIQQLMKQTHEDRNARLLKARLDIARGKVKEGREALEAIVQEAPDSVNGYLFLGKAYAIEGQWEKARSAYNKVLEEVPNHFFANLDLAKVYLEMGRPEDSLEAIAKVLKARPESPEARRLRAEALLRTGDAAKAEKIYRDLLKDSPKDALLTMRLGQCLEAQGHDQEALDKYDAAQKLAPKAVEPVLRSIVLFESKGRNADVERVGAAYLKKNGEVPIVLNALAANALGRGEPKIAKAYADRSLAAEPKGLVAQELQARALLAEKDFDGARKILEAAREAAPNRISTLLLLSSVHEQQGHQEEAQKIYEQILKIDADNPVAANNLAMIYSRDQLRLAEALKLAQIAVERAPDNAFTRDTLGWVHYRMGAFQLAATDLEQARKSLPENPEIAYHLGVTYAKLGKKDEAKKLLQEALESKQKGEWAFDAGQALESLGKP